MLPAVLARATGLSGGGVRDAGGHADAGASRAGVPVSGGGGAGAGARGASDGAGAGRDLAAGVQAVEEFSFHTSEMWAEGRREAKGKWRRRCPWNLTFSALTTGAQVSLNAMRK